MAALKDMPNIGAVNAEKLEKAGVKTPEDLRGMGAKEAFMKVRVHSDPGACLHMLYGLEAAIQGVPKKALPQESKDELKRFFNSL